MITIAYAPMDGWLFSPWTLEPSQTASSGLPVHTLSARNAMAAASRIGLSLPDALASGADSAIELRAWSWAVGAPGFEPGNLRHPKAARYQTAPRPEPPSLTTAPAGNGSIPQAAHGAACRRRRR